MARLIEACHSDFILPRMVATGQEMVREKKDSSRWGKSQGISPFIIELVNSSNIVSAAIL